MHGTFRGEPPRRGRNPRRGPGLALAIRILLREAATGCVLYAILGRDPRLDAVLCAVVLIALGLTTQKYSLLGRKDGLALFIECLVVFCGGLVFRNLLILLPAFLAAPK